MLDKVTQGSMSPNPERMYNQINSKTRFRVNISVTKSRYPEFKHFKAEA